MHRRGDGRQRLPIPLDDRGRSFFRLGGGLGLGRRVRGIRHHGGGRIDELDRWDLYRLGGREGRGRARLCRGGRGRMGRRRGGEGVARHGLGGRLGGVYRLPALLTQAGQGVPHPIGEQGVDLGVQSVDLTDGCGRVLGRLRPRVTHQGEDGAQRGHGATRHLGKVALRVLRRQRLQGAAGEEVRDEGLEPLLVTSGGRSPAKALGEQSQQSAVHLLLVPVQQAVVDHLYGGREVGVARVEHLARQGPSGLIAEVASEGVHGLGSRVGGGAKNFRIHASQSFGWESRGMGIPQGAFSLGRIPFKKCGSVAKKRLFVNAGGLCPEGRVSYTASMSAHKPTVLLIIDGFGVAPSDQGNAIKQAKMPRFQALVQSYPAMTVQASGAAVGLSWGEMGNSEVGHLTIGAGRVFYQSFPRINLEIETERFYANPSLVQATQTVKNSGGTLHLIGCVSVGNVHASQEHLYALLELARRQGVKRVCVHAILDGRDTAFDSGRGFITELEEKMGELGVGRIASVSGRYYAMDRDNRWDRIELAYNAMAKGEGPQAASAIEVIEASYAQKVYDEQVVPTVIAERGEPVGRIAPGDAVIFANFRPDRARELTKAFVLPGFEKFARPYIERLAFVTMTEYEKDLPVDVAYPPHIIESCLAKVVADAGLRQLHIAETEKYAHITFFLNGTVEDPFEGEGRAFIPSPNVSSYDKAPEMSAPEITKKTIEAIESDKYDVILLNFANADMVGHTGDRDATIKGCEAIDKGLGKIAEYVKAKGGILLITADHGNAEEVVNLKTGEKDKEHSNNPVPFLIIGEQFRGLAGPTGDPPEGDLSLVHPVGILADVAPTLLKVLGIEQPPEMTGRSLI